MNAWSTDNRICLGQIKVDDKSNEIIAMPQLMEMLDLKGTIITADAMNTQKATAKKAIDKEADYVLPVKGNQPTLLKDIELAFEGLDKDLADNQSRWNYEVKKAKEHRDRERLEKLLKNEPKISNSTYWESGIEKVHGRIEKHICTVMPVGDLPFFFEDLVKHVSICCDLLILISPLVPHKEINLQKWNRKLAT